MEAGKCKVIIHVYKGSGNLPTYELQTWSEAKQVWYGLACGSRQHVLDEMNRLGISQDIKYEKCIHEE